MGPIGSKVIEVKGQIYVVFFCLGPIFSNGQLYVAMSRVQNKNNLKIVTLNGQFADKDGMYTDNVVYKEILT